MSGRAMKYPYTISAKIAQFPYAFYWRKNWVFKYYLIAVGVSIPIFAKFSQLANSPENVKKWNEQKAREAAEHHH